MTKRRNGEKTPTNAPKGNLSPPWKPGQSGNPKGRKKGARNKATLAALELLDGEAEVLSRKAIDLALEGDTTALRLCLERIAPPRRDVPIKFDLPELETAADAATAMARVVEAVACGEMTPTEGSAVATLIEGFRKTLEVEDLARRLEALEQSLDENGHRR